jgi:osmotically-inducible protein OsmY
MPMDLPGALQMGDHEIERQVVVKLAQKNRPSLRRLAVQVHHGIVTLSGCVHSFYEKQLAIHSCLAVAGRGCMVDAVQVSAG